MTTTYRRHIAQGDGPAFLALFAPHLEEADGRLTSLKIAHRRSGGLTDFPAGGGLDYLFLSGRNQSPTDLPSTSPTPTAPKSLIGVWLAADDLSRERQLLQGLGAPVVQADVRVPDAVHAPVARLREGDVVLLPASRQLVAGRRIVGAKLRIANLDTARAMLGRCLQRRRRRSSRRPRAAACFCRRHGRTACGLSLFREPIRRPLLGHD